MSHADAQTSTSHRRDLVYICRCKCLLCYFPSLICIYGKWTQQHSASVAVCVSLLKLYAVSSNLCYKEKDRCLKPGMYRSFRPLLSYNPASLICSRTSETCDVSVKFPLFYSSEKFTDWISFLQICVVFP